MGWRFRRSVKIIPGVRMNIGKSGVTSFTLGHGLNVNKKGYRATYNLPGSGISYQCERKPWQSAPTVPTIQQPTTPQASVNARFIRFLIKFWFAIFAVIAIAAAMH